MARAIQNEVDSVGLGQPAVPQSSSDLSWLNRFDELVTVEPIRETSRQLFVDGHFARSVEEAYKCLNNEVKLRSGLSSADGVGLMRTAFSAKSPMLRINDLGSSSKKDEQRGYMDIFAGVMAGIRNPRAHEHELEDEPEVALELTILANHLMRKLQDTDS